MKKWFNQINAIPYSKKSKSYLRLKRIFTDQTRFHGKKDSEKRYHEFYNIHHETNLTTTLWENFAIINPDIWIKEILKSQNLDFHHEKIIDCNWSYEWEKKLEKGIKLCDAVIKFKTEKNNEYIIVVESKNLGKSLSEKDTKPEYYLEIEDFKNFKDRFIIYCVDDTVEDYVRKQILNTKEKYNILTWQKLAKIQFECIKKENFNDELKAFLCGTILNQFNSKFIYPELPFEYLKEEITEKDFEENKNLRNRKFWNE